MASDPVQASIAKTITDNDVVLFMKGTKQFPQCGFSATAAKILANLIIFLIPWLLLTAGAICVLLLPGATHGLVPFTAIMAVEMLVTTSLIVVAGVITESQAWTTVGIFCSSLGINILGYVFAHLRGISSYMWGNRVHWSPTAWIVLLAELLVVPLLLGMAFFIQSRKTDFL